MKKKTKGGDCYQAACQFALGNIQPDMPFGGTPYVVHAEVRGQGAIEGLRYGHAWVEDDNFVYDYSNGRTIVIPKVLYYHYGDVRTGNPKKYRRYTFDEARMKMYDTGHYGHWDLDVLYADGGITNKFHLGGDMSKHLAPNGKPSNLTHEQWHLVRTPAFKAWFGDWENNPQEASKVVDENGEPLVVYHGAEIINKKEKGRFNIFNRASYFTDTYKSAEYYAFKLAYGIDDVKEEDTEIYAVFLNIKNPKMFDYKNQDAEEYFHDFYENDKRIIQYETDGYDGLIWQYDYKMYDVSIKDKETHFITFHPTQIKLADGTNTTFDGNNPDIRFEEGGKVNLAYKVPDLDVKNTYHEFSYNFTTDSGVNYVVDCEIGSKKETELVDYINKKGVKKQKLKDREDMVLTVSFATKGKRKNKYGKDTYSFKETNRGELYRVMATISEIVKTVIKNNKDITFVQFRPLGIDKGDDRRLMLYTRAIKKDLPNSTIEKGYFETYIDRNDMLQYDENNYGIKIKRKDIRFEEGGIIHSLKRILPTRILKASDIPF